MQTDSIQTSDTQTLILGGTGKTGRRVAASLRERGMNVRTVSRSSTPSFDWHDQSTWRHHLSGITQAYISYAPDLAVPGAADHIQAFVKMAVECGVERLVLLSGRGEEEAQICEAIVQNAGVEWTIVRSSWFMQNFSEGEFLGMVLGGTITLPAADVGEPFVDVDDIADVVVAALTERTHHGQVYELTGPRLLTMTELAREIANASGRQVQFVRVPNEAFAKAIVESGAPAEVAWLLNYLFGTVLDGRNAYLCDGVQRALGREPRDFAEFARDVAARGIWHAKIEGKAA
ncbi:MAG: NAD(P)H-binding protein [Burkholderiaceae bacterium]